MFFTVFTPTFNRSHLLHRVYNSLCYQTCTDFEWLVVDDGSTDSTEHLVKVWQQRSHFPIRYYYQDNQGKHIAWNKAADIARGQYFICADSDDEFVPHALESIRTALESIPFAKRDRIFGTSCLCKDPCGVTVGDKFPAKLIYSNFIDLHFRRLVRGEKWNCGRTQIHRKIRFDESIKGSLVPEGTVWMRIAREYDVLLLNESLRIFYPEPDSICHTFSYAKNAEGMRSLSMWILNELAPSYRIYSLPLLLNYACMYVRSSFHLRKPMLKQMRELKNCIAVSMFFLMLPKGVVLYARDAYYGLKNSNESCCR